MSRTVKGVHQWPTQERPLFAQVHRRGEQFVLNRLWKRLILCNELDMENYSPFSFIMLQKA